MFNPLKQNLFMCINGQLVKHVLNCEKLCLCENKGADQLHSNCEADQRLCFRYMDSTISRLFKSEISSFYPSSVAAQANLCQTWLKTPKTGFLVSRLIHYMKKEYTIISFIFAVFLQNLYNNSHRTWCCHSITFAGSLL